MATRPVYKAIFEVKNGSFPVEAETSPVIAVLLMQFAAEKRNCSLDIVYTSKDEYPEEKIRLVKVEGQLLFEET